MTIVKIYGWLSGIIVAFAGAYLTATLTAVIPAPKELLCKLGLGFCSAPFELEFGATDVDRIRFPENVGQGPGPNQIGMLHNMILPNPSERPNAVTYQLDDIPDGRFELRVLYAAATPRPIDVLANNTLVASSVLSNATGGWNNNDREWSGPIPIEFAGRTKSITLRRSSVFPHLSKIQLKQISVP